VRRHIHIGLLVHLVRHAVVGSSCLPSRSFLIILRIGVLTLRAVDSNRRRILLSNRSLQNANAGLLALSGGRCVLGMGRSPLNRVLVRELADFIRSVFNV
jgi:hypothetical protein